MNLCMLARRRTKRKIQADGTAYGSHVRQYPDYRTSSVPPRSVLPPLTQSLPSLGNGQCSPRICRTAHSPKSTSPSIKVFRLAYAPVASASTTFTPHLSRQPRLNPVACMFAPASFLRERLHSKRALRGVHDEGELCLDRIECAHDDAVAARRERRPGHVDASRKVRIDAAV
eukprot:4882588-Pleurochrysis_carterae.AAC.7